MASSCDSYVYIVFPDLCTLEICSVECQGIIHYLPNLTVQYVYMSIFALLLVLQAGLGIRYRTWGFSIAMFCGMVLEVLGYAGRVQLHSNPFSMSIYVIYLVGLTIGPTFISASIYLCLARIVKVYGVHFSRWKPRAYTITFMSFDFISLVLQAVGGAIASTANDPDLQDAGVNIMVAGLAFQVFSLIIFMAMTTEFAWMVRKSSDEKESGFEALRMSSKFRAFLYALAIATITIFIRSTYRVAELGKGFNSPIANNETVFNILEGPMVMVAVVALTIFHPGFGFDGSWDVAGWSLRKG